MSVYKQRKSKYWSMRFEWRGREIRRSTKATNKRTAEQIEAAYRTALAKGEVGIEDMKPAPILADFLKDDFLPFYRRTRGETEPNTVRDYEGGSANIANFAKLARLPLDQIDHDAIQAFIEHRQRYRKANGHPLGVATINHDLRTLRRAAKLAEKWGRIRRAFEVKMLPGEKRRDRALSEAEDAAYIAATLQIAAEEEARYQDALKGIRATLRGQQPRKPDSYLLRDFALLMLDAGLRPEECYGLTAESIRDGKICIADGKTKAAKRQIPIMTDRLRSALDMRLSQVAAGDYLFPSSGTASGHMEESTVRDLHAKALKLSGVLPFPPYVMRHTCLTRWGDHMDTFRLMKYAGHTDIKTTTHYVHPPEESTAEAMARDSAARQKRIAAGQGRHTFRHTEKSGVSQEVGELREVVDLLRGLMEPPAGVEPATC